MLEHASSLVMGSDLSQRALFAGLISYLILSAKQCHRIWCPKSLVQISESLSSPHLVYAIQAMEDNSDHRVFMTPLSLDMIFGPAMLTIVNAIRFRFG
jgi:hypothetical protein